jgi:hypothetical protein
MVGWSVEQGQPQIFSILDPLEIDMRLTPIMLMIPRKSLTFVLGLEVKMITIQEDTICFGSVFLPCDLTHPVFLTPNIGRSRSRLTKRLK